MILFMMHSLVLGQQLPDSETSSSDTLTARNWITQAVQFQNAFKFDSSSIYYGKAGQIYHTLLKTEANRVFWAKAIHCMNEIGYNHRRIGTYDQGMEILKQAQELGKIHLTDDHPEIISNHYNIGFILLLTEQHHDALAHFQKALDLGISTLGESHMLVNTNNICIGHVYKELGKYDDAIKNYNRFLSLAIPSVGEDHIKVAYTYGGIAEAMFYKNRFDTAIEFEQKAIDIIMRLFGEKNPELGNCYNRMGVYYEYKGFFEESFQYYQKALNLLFNTLGKDHFLVACIYTNLGSVFRHFNQYDQALKYLEKSEEIHLQLPESNDRAQLYLNLGVVYAKTKEYDKAIASYKKSGEIIDQIYGQNHWRAADSKNNIGAVYYRKGDFSNAIKYFIKAMPIYRQHLGVHHERTAIAYHNIADSYYHLKDYEQATKWNQKSLAALIPDFTDTSGTGNPELSVCISNHILMYVLDLKIQICMGKYEQSPGSLNALKLAHETVALSIAWIDRIRTEFITEESKLIQGETAKTFYQYAVQTADEIYRKTRDAVYLEKIFKYIEKSKCAVLTSLLHESKIKQSFNLPDRLLQRDKALRGELAHCRTEIQKELTKKHLTDKQKLRKFQDQYFDAFIRYQQLIDTYEHDYPEYYQLKYQIHTATLHEIQQSLAPETALLEYYTTDDAIHLFVISKNDIKYHKLNIDMQFENNLRRYIQSIKKIDAKTYLELSPQLTQVLIPDELPPSKRLVIIPHGLLYKLPFESLVIKAPEQNETGNFSNLNYLIQDYDVSYHYSATLFRQGLQMRRANPGSSDSKRMEFAGFAPVFKSSDKNAIILASHLRMVDTTAAGMDTRSISLDGKTFNALPNTENELMDIAATFQADHQSVNTFLYQKASEERFKQVASNYRIIHIATHSIMNAKNPRLSGIILSQPQDSIQGEDGVLYTEEIYNLDLNADLLVLSSCESGTGKLRPGEGLMSLSRGFMYAGVRNLIVSLWKVDDASTCQLMSEFYSHHMNKKSYASSLRQAKLRMIKNPETAFPRMWSGFVLIGE